MASVALLLLLTCMCHFALTTGRNFTVDYKANTFLKDGKPFRYISGSMHYFRIPQIYWRDRIRKMKACGLDAVETYIPWNFHSPSPGKYYFDGQRDISKFLEIVNEEGLVAILRGFPYCDTEWDMGGMPGWLLKSDRNPADNRITLRSSDSRFLSAVSEWLNNLIPRLKPLSYSRGGPIVLVQVENEYGSYPHHDDHYLEFLRDELSRQFDDENVVLFTTDGNSKGDLQRGSIPNVLQTVDFGPGASVVDSFKLLRTMLPHGPLVNSEFYTGWLDHWGEKHHRTPSSQITASLDLILSLNASVNFYMFVGGTNFGYWSGSNGPPVQQIVTSYDYDSPIAENGDTTEKFFAIRRVISKYKPLPSLPIPPNVTKFEYGSIDMINLGPMWENLDVFSPTGPVKNHSPMSFEDLDAIGGYVIYRTVIHETPSQPALLRVANSIRDYGRVYINSVYISDLKRGSTDLHLHHGCRPGDQIDIVVTSLGRICYGGAMNDSKGMDGPVMLVDSSGSTVPLYDWEMWVLNFQYEFLEQLLLRTKKHAYSSSSSLTVFVSMPFEVGVVADTFISPSNSSWNSGYAVVNGINLGKYNVIGPQRTLYLPTVSVVDSRVLQINLIEENPSEKCSRIGTSCPLMLSGHPDLG